MSCLSLQGVGFHFPDDDRPILKDIGFELCEGERLTLLGPSGSGKSTILRLIVRLDEATEGTIRTGDRSIDDLPVRELRQRLALVPQEPTLLGLSVRENLELAAELHDIGDGDTPGLEGLLQQVDLAPDIIDRGPRELSVGQKQRVTLARALVTRPAALLLDEPTSALDPGSQASVAELLDRVADETGTAVLAVTHAPEFARALGGRGIFLRQGRIEDCGDMDELLDRDGDSPIRRFLNGELRESS
jgi:ABC-type multidrug transport system ATPase subunit